MANYDVYYLLVIQSLAVLIGQKNYKFITVVIKHDYLSIVNEYRTIVKTIYI